jgi:hypothetical protein
MLGNGEIHHARVPCFLVSPPPLQMLVLPPLRATCHTCKDKPAVVGTRAETRFVEQGRNDTMGAETRNRCQNGESLTAHSNKFLIELISAVLKSLLRLLFSVFSVTLFLPRLPTTLVIFDYHLQHCLSPDSPARLYGRPHAQA